MTVIPAAALQRGPNGPFVYVVVDDTAELRTVVPGTTDAGRTAILSGVSVGERIITAGLDRLRPGAKVVVEVAAEKSAATADAPKNSAAGKRNSPGDVAETRSTVKSAD